MSWRAPEIAHKHPEPLVGDERTMLEEYARHNGHADLLRERVDGVTGV